MSTHNLFFEQEYEKNIRIFYLKLFLCSVVKYSIYLNTRVLVMISLLIRLATSRISIFS